MNDRTTPAALDVLHREVSVLHAQAETLAATCPAGRHRTLHRVAAEALLTTTVSPWDASGLRIAATELGTAAYAALVRRDDDGWTAAAVARSYEELPREAAPVVHGGTEDLKNRITSCASRIALAATGDADVHEHMLVTNLVQLVGLCAVTRG